VWKQKHWKVNTVPFSAIFLAWWVSLVVLYEANKPGNHIREINLLNAPLQHKISVTWDYFFVVRHIFKTMLCLLSVSTDIKLSHPHNIYIYNIRTLSVNITFICTSFRNRQNSEPSVSFSSLFRSEYKWFLYLTTMYVYCV
jgi:hypothetical protein